MLARLKALGKYVGELIGGSNPDQTEVTILNRFVREVLANVDMLSTLSSTDDMVAPFNARIVVFIDWCISRRPESHILEKRPEVYDFHCSSGCCIVLSLCSRECDGLLQLRPPVDWSTIEPEDVTGGRSTRAAVSPIGITVTLKTRVVLGPLAIF